MSLPRRTLFLAHINGALWSVGNGLTSGTLVIYLAMELGARGIALSWVLALPSLVGLLRMAAPKVIEGFGSNRAAAIGLSLASYLLLLLFPLVPQAGTLLPGLRPIVALVVLLAVHQLLESLGAVALFAWLAELVPADRRGRFFGWRNFCQLAVLIPALLVSGYYTDLWKAQGRAAAWTGHITFGMVGAGLLLISLVPLAWMPAKKGQTHAAGPSAPAQRGSSWAAALFDPVFRRFLYFSCWFSFSNGLTQSAQNLFPNLVLGLGVLPMSLLRTGMRGGQLLLSPPLGRAADLRGNRRILAASQAIVATGLVYFAVASPQQPWWVAGAFVAWSAYAGLNIAMPNFVMKQAPPGETAGYLAAHYALSSVCYAVSTLAGGYLHDLLMRRPELIGAASTNAVYTLEFTVGTVARLLALELARRIVERGCFEDGGSRTEDGIA